MTVSVNYSHEFNVDELCRLAFQATGTLEAGKEPTAEEKAMARDFMNLELQALQAEGVILRTVERATLTLVSGTASYSLPADTIDVQLGPNDQIGTIVPSSGSESIVTSMTRAEYLDIADKTSATTGRPTRAYVEKLATVTVTLWPVPDSTSATLRYARTRLLRDADTGAVTVDLARRWLKFVVAATAVWCGRAKSLSYSAVNGLRDEAERMKAVCKGDDKQSGRIRFRMAHSGRSW